MCTKMQNHRKEGRIPNYYLLISGENKMKISVPVTFNVSRMWGDVMMNQNLSYLIFVALTHQLRNN